GSGGAVGERAVSLGQRTLETFTHRARQGGTGPARGDGHGQRAAMHDGGKDRVAMSGIVRGVDPHSACAAFARDFRVHGAIVGGGERQDRAGEVAGGVCPRHVGDQPGRGQLRERRRKGGAHDGDDRTDGEQRENLALGHGAAAEHDARAPPELDEERKERHDYASTPAGSRPPAGSRWTAGTGPPASSARSVESSWRAAKARKVSPRRRSARYARRSRSTAGATSVAGTRRPIGRATDSPAPSAPPTQK